MTDYHNVYERLWWLLAPAVQGMDGYLPLGEMLDGYLPLGKMSLYWSSRSYYNIGLGSLWYCVTLEENASQRLTTLIHVLCHYEELVLWHYYWWSVFIHRSGVNIRTSFLGQYPCIFLGVIIRTSFWGQYSYIFLGSICVHHFGVNFRTSFWSQYPYIILGSVSVHLSGVSTYISSWGQYL